MNKIIIKPFIIENSEILNYLGIILLLAIKCILRLIISALFSPLYTWLSFLHVMSNFFVSLFTFTVTRQPNSPIELIQTEIHSFTHIPILKREQCVKKVHFLLILLLISQSEHMLGIESHIKKKHICCLIIQFIRFF